MDGQPPEGENGISHWRPASRNDEQSDRIKNKRKQEKMKTNMVIWCQIVDDIFKTPNVVFLVGWKESFRKRPSGPHESILC